MNYEAHFTKAFGIAPIQKMPEGVQITRIPLPRSHDALAALDLSQLPKLPYWQVLGRSLRVITDHDADLVAKALWDVFPPDETAYAYWPGRSV